MTLEFHGLKKEGPECEHCGRTYLQKMEIEDLGEWSFPIQCGECAEFNGRLAKANALIAQTNQLLSRVHDQKRAEAERLLAAQKQARNKILNEARQFLASRNQEKSPPPEETPPHWQDF